MRLPAAMLPIGDAPLRYGLTLDYLYELTMIAVRCEKWYQARDFHERANIAWSGIVEHLYASEKVPTRSDLICAGMRAIRAMFEDERRQHGLNTHDRYAGTGVNFERYWFLAAQPPPGPEDHVVERMALRQIWAELSSYHREALTTLAATDDYDQAADALGKSRATFYRQVGRARHAFLALWHDGEQPSRIWAYDRRRRSPANDHPFTGIIRDRKRKKQPADEQALGESHLTS